MSYVTFFTSIICALFSPTLVLFSSPPLVSFSAPSPHCVRFFVHARLLGPWDKGKSGYQDNRTQGYKDIRTLGHFDTGTMEQWVPTYRNHIVMFHWIGLDWSCGKIWVGQCSVRRS